MVVALLLLLLRCNGDYRAYDEPAAQWWAMWHSCQNCHNAVWLPLEVEIVMLDLNLDSNLRHGSDDSLVVAVVAALLLLLLLLALTLSLSLLLAAVQLAVADWRDADMRPTRLAVDC